MNATSQYFELAQLESRIMKVAAELAALSNDENIVTLNGSNISVIYVGRGTEHISLTLNGDGKYSIDERINYIKSNLKRLVEIKRDCFEWDWVEGGIHGQ